MSASLVNISSAPAFSACSAGGDVAAFAARGPANQRKTRPKTSLTAMLIYIVEERPPTRSHNIGCAGSALRESRLRRPHDPGRAVALVQQPRHVGHVGAQLAFAHLL